MHELILRSKLFSGLEEDIISRIISCIDHKRLSVNRDSCLYDYSKGFIAGVILAGRIDLATIDNDGRETIDRIYKKGDSFAIRFDSLNDRILIAREESKFFLLNVSNIFLERKKSCQFRAIFMENLIKELDRHTAYLTYKMNIYSKSTIREKILAYMEGQKEDLLKGKLSREDLANFLSCNRSALSRELSRLKSEGITI